MSGYVLRLNDEPADALLPRRNELKEFAMIIPAYMNKERQRGRGGRPLQRSGELNQFDVMRSPFNMTLPLRFQLRKRLRFGLPTLANRPFGAEKWIYTVATALAGREKAARWRR